MKETGWKRKGVYYIAEKVVEETPYAVILRTRGYFFVTYWIIYYLHGPEKLRKLGYDDLPFKD